MAKSNTFNETIVLNEADALTMMQQRLKSVQTNVVDFDTNSIIKKYISKGGYDFSLSLDANVELLIKVIAITKAKGKI